MDNREKITIFLMGIKHCGKSTLGKALSCEWKLKFFDLDQLTESEYTNSSFFLKNRIQYSCREIYKKYGSSFFKGLEASASKRLSSYTENTAFIAALGGGTIENPPALDALANSGLFVYLKVGFDTLYNRIIQTGIPPFINKNDPYNSFLRLYKKRTVLYEQKADIIVSLDDKDIKNSLSALKNKLTEHRNGG